MEKKTQKDKTLFSLLPRYTLPTNLLFGDMLPCRGAKIKMRPLSFILTHLQRQTWAEGLYVHKEDLEHVLQYKNADGSFKHDFTEENFLTWIKNIEENTAICAMNHKELGKGVFVPPKKCLPKNTFIAASGIIKLNPTREEQETEVHCSALWDLHSRHKTIYGLINPKQSGGLFNLINHAMTEAEMAYFSFKNPSFKNQAATANLKSTIKFYNGYAIFGVENTDDIWGNSHGKQLLWSYAHPCEYISCKPLLLFDDRDSYQGEVLDPTNYSLKEITIFIDTNDWMLRKVASLTQWEIMEKPPDAPLIIVAEDPFSSRESRPVQSPILFSCLQKYLQKNPQTERIIVKIPNLY